MSRIMRVRLVVAATTLLAGCVFQTQYDAVKSKLWECEQQRKSLEQQRDRLEAELVQAQGELGLVRRQLAQVQGQAKRAQADAGSARRRLDAANKRAAAAKVQADRLRRTAEKIRTQVAELNRKLKKEGLHAALAAAQKTALDKQLKAFVAEMVRRAEVTRRNSEKVHQKLLQETVAHKKAQKALAATRASETRLKAHVTRLAKEVQILKGKVIVLQKARSATKSAKSPPPKRKASKAPAKK